MQLDTATFIDQMSGGMMATSRDSSQRRQEADDIRVLKGLASVRLSPGMYVGQTPDAIYHMANNVLDYPINDAMAGRCSGIDIIIHGDSSMTISDNGPGLAVVRVESMGLSELEIELTLLVIPGRPSDHLYHVCGGLHGIGLKPVNALSEWLIAEVRRDGYVWRQSYERGKRTSDVVKARPMKMNESTGTSITFRPDPEIMGGFPTEFDYNYDVLSKYCHNLAYVLNGITIVLKDQRSSGSPRKTTFHFEDGLKAFVSELNHDRKPLHDIVSGTKSVQFSKSEYDEGTIEVEFAFQYTDDLHSTERFFVNTVETIDGSTHQAGLRTALTRTSNKWTRKNGYWESKEDKFTWCDTLKGLTAVVSLRHPNPQFESQTKVKLMNPEVRNIVTSTISAVYTQFLEKNPEEARRIADHIHLTWKNG
jgi:DNA gyrase subunit B